MKREYISLSIYGEPLKVLEDSEDIMDCIVECLHCGRPVRYGNQIRMFHGYVGCDLPFPNGDTCYTDLITRVDYAKEHNHDDYVNGTIYLKYHLQEREEILKQLEKEQENENEIQF